MPIATVQQEINAIVRPSADALAACVELRCQFVAYGPLLGGLLTDAYLGAPRPRPDAEHTKQLDYLASIDAWASWREFQTLLGVLRKVGDAHGGAGIGSVALAYVLKLEYVVAVISGVRLGLNITDDVKRPHRRHRKAALDALQLELSAEEVKTIDAAVAKGKVLDGLQRT